MSRAVLFAVLVAATTTFAEDSSKDRIPWTTSRIVGSPEPPSPYVTERIWPKLAFDQPVEMVVAPGESRPYVVERKGRILRLPDDASSDAVEVVLDGAKEIEGLTAAYGLAFHPKYATNRTVFVCYILKPELPNGTRVSRFRMTQGTADELPRIDPTTETILLEWKSGGHNGGSLKFGPDGYLYISTGDGSPPSPPDEHDTGQDLSDLLASILRIDVDHEADGRPYAIPEDNPFVGLEDARPEVWAYGLRNPWRMSFDTKTGDLWLGDVGWQLWEMVHRIERGGNYGWSVKEGPQHVRPTATHGPTPISPPVKSLPRAEAASVTGGFVYHGERLPDLRGTYVYGDYVTGKIWSLKYDEGEVVDHRELVDTRYAIICFFEDHDGEIAFLDYNAGTIHRLVPNEAVGRPSDFPTKLSETGLFASTSKHEPAAGVYPFEINVERWMDGARGERLVAIPGHGTMTLREPTERVPKNWGSFPENTVLAKTIFVERNGERRRLETQILHNSGERWRENSGEWFGYTYVWNDEQTDATLAPAQGRDLDVTVGGEKVRWHVASRTECYACHNPWAGYRLGFTIPQLNRDVDGHSQLERFEKELGLVELEPPKKLNGSWPPRLDQWPTPDPADRHIRLGDEQGARSYLHVNCAHCHRFGGGGTATIQLRYDLPLEETGLLDGKPTQGTFGIDRARLVAPGDPAGSVLLYRMAKLGRGRMPHIGSSEVDHDAVSLVGLWINSLHSHDPPAVVGQRINDAFRLRRLGDALDPEERVRIESTFLESTRSAHATSWAIAANRSDPKYSSFVSRAAADPRPEIRDLFEPFLPPEKRIRRLGNAVEPAAILALEGDAESGQRLFAESTTLQCRSCHRVGDVGKRVGPDLLGIGKRLDRKKLLRSILDPSAEVDPNWRSFVVETKRGRVHSGMLIERSPEVVVLRGADGKDVRVEAADVESLVPQARSLMPDLQFRDLTAAQLADLVAYLASLDEADD